MTVTETAGTALTEQQLNTLLQYTIEAYKTFEKYAENLPNPVVARMFKQFALNERETRDLLDLKLQAAGGSRVRVTLGGDMQFEDALRGELSDREKAEFLIARERTMHRKLVEWASAASKVDKGLLIYIAAGKRAHMVELERELELIRLDSKWFTREDAESRLVHGPREGN